MTQPRNPEAGLSLTEVLTVLAIVAVTVGASLLAFGRADAVLVEAEARRLADRLQLAADEALISGSPLALAWEANGYHFLAWEADSRAWVAPAIRLLKPHGLPRGLDLGRESGPEQTVMIRPDALSEPVMFRVSDGQTKWLVRFDGVSTTAEPVS